MGRIKTAAVVLLLVLLTALVVLTPLFTGGQNENYTLNKKNYWQYNKRSSNEITSKQVAAMYYNEEISSVSSVFDYNKKDCEDADTAGIRDETQKLLYIFFNGDDKTFNSLQSILEGEIIFCSKKSVLLLINDSPVALSFIAVNYLVKNTCMEFTYEQKTQTLISFACTGSNNDRLFDISLLTKAFREASNRYYGDVLCLNREQYFYTPLLETDSFGYSSGILSVSSSWKAEGDYYYR